MSWKDRIAALCGALFIFMPRASPALLAIAGAICVFKNPPSRDEIRRLSLLTAAFTAYPLLSATWSLDWDRSLTVVAVFAAIVLTTFLIYQRAGKLKDVFAAFVLVGIPVVVTIGFVDLLFGMPLRSMLLSFGVSWVGQSHMVQTNGATSLSAANWSVACVALALFPYWELSRTEGGSMAQKSIRLIVAVAMIGTIFISQHQASMLGVVVGGVVYLMSHWSKKAALVVTAAGWLACIAAMPLMITAFISLTPSVDEELPKTFQHRVVIWRTAVKEIYENPWIGSGAGSTRITFRKEQMNQAPKIDRTAPGIFSQFSGIVPHSHNWFLDLWRELGAIGALIAFIGASLIARRLMMGLDKVSGEQLAFLALVLGISSVSFGLWAFWYVSAIGIAFAMFGLRNVDPIGEAT